MCGIAGIVGPTGELPDASAILCRMMNIMAHRGPDDEGAYIDDGAALGFRRLSIIDLQSGHQPIFNEDRSCVIVFNGEVYNYKELRADLVKRGHTFATNTDTETVLHLYEDLGEKCVEHLNGMFAFCIWDTRRRSAFFARDRLGKKPLYYCRSGEHFLFASEIKSILATGMVPARVSFETLNHYLSYRYCPAPGTPFEAISKLPPAGALRLDGDAPRVSRYWKVRDFTKLHGSEAYLKQMLLDKLRLAVKRRLMSDVPLGLFLSGGIDSSAVLALMAEGASEPVKTFSIGFDFGPQFQEFEFANRVAELFRTDHHTTVIGSEEFLKEVPRIVWHLDELVADSATIPLYFVARMAKKHITVALSGEGSDELFAGYARQYVYQLRRYQRRRTLRSFPGATRGRLVERLVRTLFPRHLDKFLFVKEPIGRPSSDVMSGYYATNEKEALLVPEAWDRIQERDSSVVLDRYLEEYGDLEYLDRKLLSDMAFWLPDDLLIKADRATMANGVELRVPFLDYELVEFSFRLEDDLKVRGSEYKYILKKAFEGILPGEILYRKKMGFPVPLAGWFRGVLKESIYEILLGRRSTARGIFRPEAVRAVLDEHVSGRSNLESHVWILVVFEIWCRLFVDGERFDQISLV